VFTCRRDRRRALCDAGQRRPPIRVTAHSLHKTKESAEAKATKLLAEHGDAVAVAVRALQASADPLVQMRLAEDWPLQQRTRQGKR
jgi:alpha-beta hydrolase superfamily lysophospholipase